jgi:hypothetical protein
MIDNIWIMLCSQHAGAGEKKGVAWNLNMQQTLLS